MFNRTWLAHTAYLFLAGTALFGGPLAPARLRVEYLDGPPAIDVPAPRFAWVLRHSERNQKQSAYQIQVSTSAEFQSAGAWDSGKVASADSIQVEYAGRPLESDKTYFWRVKYWDASGVESPWSAAAQFSTGLLKPSDWKARWITGGNLLRGVFDIAKPVRRARVFVAATGYYELHLNGHRVGRHVLDPGWTDFSKRVLYSTYDVTGQLRSGKNAAAVLLGRGWYGRAFNQPVKLILQLQGQYEDGSPFAFVSDTNWRAYRSPIVSDDVYDGEVYDARLEQPGWDAPDFAPAGGACTLADLSGVVLSSQSMPAIEVTDTLAPHRMTEPKPGVFVFDFDQNFSGWVRLKVRGPAGTRVRLRFAELLHPDGTLNVENLRSARATDTYILRGDGTAEVYEPRFTYHGFRYAEITGYPGVPTLDSIRGRVVHSAVAPIGNFSCSNVTLNKLQHAMMWGIKTNLHAVPTDCDQRDERLGWMADAHLSSETGMFDFDMAAFYTNFLRDMQDAQGARGEVPNIVPYITRFNPSREGDPAWGAAYPLMARFLYEQYGDKRILAEHYNNIKAWADFLRRHSPDGIPDYSYFGDWVPVDPTPKQLAATWAYIESVDTVVTAAKILGKQADAAAYGKLAAEIRAAFNRKYLGPDGYYLPGSQAAQVLALAVNAPPAESAGSALDWLVQDINYHHNAHLTTGILATKYLWPVLTERGQVELAYDVLTRPDYPGYGFMINQGATTLWELWQQRSGPQMNSHNHHMFASVGTFLYRTLAGLESMKPGYEEIRIRPNLVHGLDYASASTETMRGEAAASWRRVDTGYVLEATVPVGSTATIHLPLLRLANPVIAESGRPVFSGGGAISGVPGINAVRRDGQSVVVEAGSGIYRFSVSEQPLN